MTYENCPITCRTCLTQNIEMKSIYTIEHIFEGQVQISDILMLCASLQIDKGDGLPEYLCFRCSEELSRAYVFRKLCEKSDSILRGQLTTPIPIHQLDNLKTELPDYVIPNNEEITNTYFENNELIQMLDDDIHADEVKMESDNEDMSCTAPEILEKEALNSSTSLPDNSKRVYNKVYTSFMDWRIKKKTSSFSENVLLEYFAELAEKYKSSSLWSFFSMLKAVVRTYHDIDLGKYAKLHSFLKRQSEGYEAKKSKTFTPEDVMKFMSSAPDKIYLIHKVVLIMGIVGACRSIEMYKMKIEDVNDLNTTLIITVPKTKTKVVRTFMITGQFYNIVKKYISLRPPHVTISSFFLNYQKGKCTAQKIGKNKFGIMGTQIAKYLELPQPKEYTGHSYRSSCASLCVDEGGVITGLKRHGSWKSTQVAEGYTDQSVKNQTDTANTISKQLNNNLTSTSSSTTTFKAINNIDENREEDSTLTSQLTTAIPVYQLDNLITDVSDCEIPNNEEITNTHFESNELIKMLEDDIHSDEVKMESDTEDMPYTPPEILEEPTLSTFASLPDNSKKIYNKAYTSFMDWRIEKKTSSFSENILMAYFTELAGKYKSSSLWSFYSMLKALLNTYHDIDIGKYAKLRSFLKRQSVGYKAKKSKTFAPEDIMKFISRAPDKIYLLHKVVLVIGIVGACRSIEMYKMKIEDVNDLNTTLIITVPKTKTKIVRTFMITGQFYNIVKKYINLRPPHVTISSFFLNYQKAKCTVQKIGKNKFGIIGNQIAKYLELPHPAEYTGHSFRRSCARLCVDGSGVITGLKRHGGSAQDEGHIDQSIKDKMDTISMQLKYILPSTSTSTTISTAINNIYENSANNITQNTLSVPSTSTTVSKAINISENSAKHITQNTPPSIEFISCSNINIHSLKNE